MVPGNSGALAGSPARASASPRSPHRRPHDTLHAERFIRSVREERTDRLLMLDCGHAEKVLRDYPRNFTANHVGALGSCVTRRT